MDIKPLEDALLKHKATCVLCKGLPNSDTDPSCVEGSKLQKSVNDVAENNDHFCCGYSV